MIYYFCTLWFGLTELCNSQTEALGEMMRCYIWAIPTAHCFPFSSLLLFCSCLCTDFEPPSRPPDQFLCSMNLNVWGCFFFGTFLYSFPCIGNKNIVGENCSGVMQKNRNKQFKKKKSKKDLYHLQLLNTKA